MKMPRRVGIITMVGADNYGNALQNYAVEQLIEQVGCQPATLYDCTDKGFLNPAKKNLPLWRRLFPGYIKTFLRVRIYKKFGCKNDRDFTLLGMLRAKINRSNYLCAQALRHDKFEEFRREMLNFDHTPLSNLKFDKDYFNQYDAVVCGSDQIWGPHYKTTSMIAFLLFIPEAKRIALAPSFGVAQIPEQRRRDYTEWLNAIPRLSVREERGAAIIRELTGREAQVLLDPTFGLNADAWLSFARPPVKCPEGKYVFCYFLGNMCRGYEKWISQYATTRGLQIICTWDIACLDYYGIGPREFVWLLAHAEIIFTDSFHGTALSINLQKQFVVFDRQEGKTSMLSRIATLLKKTGLEERRYPVMTAIVDSIDFSDAVKNITEERERLKNYLSDALSTPLEVKSPLLANRYHCSGCGVCVNICHHGALRMQEDSEGFLYPRLNALKCVHCNLCSQSCPANNSACEKYKDFSDVLPQAFWGFAKDSDICARSSSGGIFSLLAKEMIKRNGVVFGVGYDENFRVLHKKITSLEELSPLCTSKYVQSDIGLIYREVRTELEKKRPVLFSGAPCQVVGLKLYLRKDYRNLFTQDIICHGVPSPKVWKKYLDEQHLTDGKKIRMVSFRDKTLGWNKFSIRVTYSDGSSYCKLATHDCFERAFLANLTLRPACHQCQFKTLKRASDITLADYWGVELVHPQLKKQEGVSLILIQSVHGSELFEALKGNCEWGETDCERAANMNHAMLHSPKAHAQRDNFFTDLDRMPLAMNVRRNLRQPLREIAKKIIVKNGSRAKNVLRYFHFIPRRGANK